MKSVKKKLKSNKGASITFALLIFLVCAMVSSVAIAAGTAAAGRMSQIAESDQRYYSVNSAAEVLKGLIDNKTVKVERAIVTREETYYQQNETTGAFEEDDDRHSTQTVSDTTTFSVDGASYEIKSAYTTTEGVTSISSTDVNTKIKESFLTDAALKTVETSAVTTGYQNEYGNISGTVTRDFVLSGTEDISKLDDICIHEEIDTDGTLTFNVYNNSPNKRYKLELVFKPDRSVNTGSKSDPPERTIVSNSPITYKDTVQKTDTTTTTLTWHLSSMKAV